MLLEIEDLTIEYELGEGSLQAVDELSLELEAGQILGLVGESGCGKSTLVKVLPHILDDNGRITNGEVRFKGQDIIHLSTEEMNDAIRWQEISYIPQNAMAALDPVYRVGKQIVQVIRVHTDKSKTEARERARQLLRRVNLEENVFSDYPHELSGGQRQRVTIALALALDPSLIIADEPTTGLDVVVQDSLIELLEEIREETGCSIILVTHDMSVIAETADQVMVMYGGHVMEEGTTREIFKETTHPYTIGLKNAFPSLAEEPGELVSIPGMPPSLTPPPSGCRFIDRCPFATAECEEEPPLAEVEDGQRSKCHYSDKAAEFREQGKDPAVWSDNA
jgi:oligopeptide/dipeptide ABC transporter ATP-binding protein